MKISCVFSKMQDFEHFPIISSLIGRLIFDFHGYFVVRDFPYGDLPHVDYPRKGFPVLALRKRTPLLG